MITPTKPMDIAWAERKLGLKFYPPYSGIAFERDDSLKAVALFNNYTGGDIEVTIAADDMPRSFLRAIRRYVVNQLGCNRATFKIRAYNIGAKLALNRLGARYEGCQSGYYADGSDALIFAIHNRDYIHG